MGAGGARGASRSSGSAAVTTIHAPFPTEVECKIGAVPRQDRLLKSWPELQIRITQLAREGSPRPVAPASGEVITQLQLDSSRTDSAVRVSYAQPSSPVSVGDVRFAKIGATLPRVSETMRNL